MNPIRMVYDTLWEMVNTVPLFTDQVKLRNRISYAELSRRDPEKRNLTEGDLPEVMLWDVNATINMWNSSSTSYLNRQYSWLINTGDKRNFCLHDIEWALFIAMHGWKTQLTALRFNDKSFVKHCQIVNTTTAITRPVEREESLPEGWSSIWTVSVEMYFDVKDIEALRD